MARKSESGMLMGSPGNSYARQRLARRGPSPPAPRCPVPGTAGIENFLLHLCSLAGCWGRGWLQAAGCCMCAGQCCRRSIGFTIGFHNHREGPF